MEPLGIYRADISKGKSAVNEWLDSLGFKKKGEVVNVEASKRKLKMVIDGREIAITLYDTPAANALYEMLPLELSFEDFNETEKISYLSQEFPVQGEPDGCEPETGDLCLYAPWGNLSIFYKDFRYSDGLIKLGHVNSGMDIISGINEDFSATLETFD
ncbi:MAG: cyclophilin-like fold protein [Candidatus Fimisoma sp.]